MILPIFKKAACTSLGESLSIGEIAQQIGLTDEEYNDFVQSPQYQHPIDYYQQAVHPNLRKI